MEKYLLLKQDLVNFFVKGQVWNILGFATHISLWQLLNCHLAENQPWTIHKQIGVVMFQ